MCSVFRDHTTRKGVQEQTRSMVLSLLGQVFRWIVCYRADGTGHMSRIKNHQTLAFGFRCRSISSLPQGSLGPMLRVLSLPTTTRHAKKPNWSFATWPGTFCRQNDHRSQSRTRREEPSQCSGSNSRQLRERRPPPPTFVAGSTVHNWTLAEFPAAAFVPEQVARYYHRQ